MTPPEKDFTRERGFLIALVFVASSLNYVDRQVLALLKPTLEAEFGWSNKEFAHLGSVFQLATAFSYLGVGWFVDKVGVRWSYMLGVGFWSLAGIAHAFAGTVQQFIAARIALAVGETVNTPAAVKSIAQYLPLRLRSIGLGIVNSAPNIGAIVTPLLIPPFALAFGWKSAFIVTGALGFAWLAFWWMGTRTIRPINAAAGDASGAAAANPPWREIFSNRGALAFIGAKALFDHVWWFILFWTPAFFNSEFGLSQGQLGGPIALVYSMAAVGALSSGGLYPLLLRRGLSPDLARKLPMLVYACLILPISLAVGADSPWVAAAIIGLALFAHQGFSTNAFGLVTDVVPAAGVGRVIAYGAFAGNLSGMGIIEFTGWSLDAGNGYAPMFAMASIAYLAALAWIQLMLPKIRPLEGAGAAR